jgi:multimeric flavodoxin WrbA
MMPSVIGISASPQSGGKVEMLVNEILSATGLTSELVRLHDITVKPCIACNGCRVDNVCVLDDDWNMLRQKILGSAAVVIGGWAFSGMIDSATKALMERFWSFRHHHQLTRGRVGAAVVVGSNNELTGKLSDMLLTFMRNNGMAALGGVTAAGANPCLGCEDSLDACEYSALVAQYGCIARKGTSMYNPIENQLKALKNARILGQRIAHKVNFLKVRGFSADPVQFNESEGAIKK